MNPRRPPIPAKSITERFAVFVSTFLYSGFLPKAPGTWGTLATLPFLWWLRHESLELKIGIIVALFALGTWAAKEVVRLTNVADHQSIVVDESIGVAVTLLLTGDSVAAFVLGALLFRLFDIVKIPPVEAVDQWSKNRKDSHWIAGFGVLADDFVAGIQGLIALELCKRFLPTFF